MNAPQYIIISVVEVISFSCCYFTIDWYIITVLILYLGNSSEIRERRPDIMDANFHDSP